MANGNGKKKTRKWWIIGGALLLVVILAGVLVAAKSGGNKIEASKLAKVEKGDLAKTPTGRPIKSGPAQRAYDGHPALARAEDAHGRGFAPFAVQFGQ